MYDIEVLNGGDFKLFLSGFHVLVHEDILIKEVSISILVLYVCGFPSLADLKFM